MVKLEGKVSTGTQTFITSGYYPVVGPFETEEEARAAPRNQEEEKYLDWGRRMSVEHTEDGWYRMYHVTTTTTLMYIENNQ